MAKEMTSADRAQEHIKILQAFIEGKPIEYREDDYDEEADWELVSLIPAWNFANIEYRIKPEPAYRPWTFQEIPVGVAVKSNSGGIVGLITRKEEGFPGKRKDMIIVGDSKHTVDTIFVHYKMSDGSPCGSKV